MRWQTTSCYIAVALLLNFTPPTRCQSAAQSGDIARLSKRLYTTLIMHSGPWNATALAGEFKKEYDHFNTDGRLAETLKSLYDIRAHDLQKSLMYARRVQEVLKVLDT